MATPADIRRPGERAIMPPELAKGYAIATPDTARVNAFLRLLRTACASLGLALATAAWATGTLPSGTTLLYAAPQRVAIRGYTGDAMEPFITRDGRFLLFNNRNEGPVNTNLYYAERVDDVTFDYKGEIAGVNTAALEGVPTLDRNRNFYFVSDRSYARTFSTLYRGHFVDGQVSNVELVPGVSRETPGWVNFDVEVSADGDTLYFVDSEFRDGGPVSAMLVVADRQGAGFVRRADSAELMRNVNAQGLVYAPSIATDGLTLFFTAARKGSAAGVAIYMATRTSLQAPFGPPLRLQALDGFVEGPSISSDGLSLYFHRRDGDHFSIYRATRQ
jgi:Tol biopolymer transport system component